MRGHRVRQYLRLEAARFVMVSNVLTPVDLALPMNYPGFVFRALRDEGIAAGALLDDTGLTEVMLTDPHHRSDFAQLRRFYLNVIAASGDPHIGIRLALRFRPSQVGLPFHAAMHAATFGDAIRTLGRFVRLTFPAIGFEGPVSRAHGSERECAVTLHPTWPLGEIAYFGTSSALIVCDGILRTLLQETPVTERAELVVAQPEGWACVARELAFPVRFGARRNALVFEASLLEAPLATHDPLILQQMLGVCDRLAEQARGDNGPAGQVLRHLEHSGTFAATVGEVAAALGFSERGLRRQLARSGTSFRGLVRQARYAKAQALLADPAIPIKTVAFALGFDTPSNFARSFKEWSGAAPSEYRAMMCAKAPSGQN
jgi:AraC-like DNA-binding protein